MKQYILWHSCYIDLIRGCGVASSFVENEEGKIQFTDFVGQQQTTINRLSLTAVRMGLKKIEKGSVIRIIGVCQYVDGALKKLDGWMAEDGIIDLKAHSETLKSIWPLICDANKVTSEYYRSRRSDPMLWATSQAAADQYRFIQEKWIENEKFPYEPWCSGSAPIEKDHFLVMKFQKPHTDLSFEKLIIKKNKQKRESIKTEETPLLRLVQ